MNLPGLCTHLLTNCDLHILHEALFEGLQGFSGYMDTISSNITNNTELNLDFRYVGDTILRTVRWI